MPAYPQQIIGNAIPPRRVNHISFCASEHAKQ
jgi:hypothetical protein